jgi:hypothetical protein
VYLGDLKGSLQQDTLTVHTEMTGRYLGPVEDLHCAVVLYALAMDLKQNYPLVKDVQEKKAYIAVITRYLTQVPLYFPTIKADVNQINQSKSELSKAVQQELKWCEEEAGKM